MCGISGIYNFNKNNPVYHRLLEKMTDLIAHRGPDDFGYHVDGNIGLGHRRLSIVDLSDAGHQPMPNEDDTVWLTYNGEFYNYQQYVKPLEAQGHVFRSHSDSEAIIHLYEEYGVDFVSKMDGMYAFALWDSRQDRLLIVRDRLGIKPLYYYYDDEHLIFASELKALLADPTLPTELDYTALSDYLHLMSIPSPHAIFKGVKRLEPGHYLLVEDGQVKDVQYWDVPDFTPDGNRSAETIYNQFDDLFTRTVDSHFMADVPVGAFLSGGVDSSSVVAVAAKDSDNPLETFAIAFKGLNTFDESPYAAQVAQQYKTNHHEFSLQPNFIEALPHIAWHADEPFAISSSFALYFLSRLAREHVKVVLTGDGGDEVFAGYNWRHSPSMGKMLKYRLKQVMIKSGMFPTLADRQMTYMQYIEEFPPDELGGVLLPEVRTHIEREWQHNITAQYYDNFKDGDEVTRRLYTDLKTTLVSEMLTKVDRMTMAFGLEARVPFLDHHVVEWAFRVPSKHKINGMEGKYLVKKAMEKYLPRDLLFRPKHGFDVPLEVWMRDQLRDFILDTLNERTIKQRGIFDPKAVRALIQQHLDGVQNASNKINIILMLELWFQKYVDRKFEAQSV